MEQKKAAQSIELVIGRDVLIEALQSTQSELVRIRMMATTEPDVRQDVLFEIFDGFKSIPFCNQELLDEVNASSNVDA